MPKHAFTTIIIIIENEKRMNEGFYPKRTVYNVLHYWENFFTDFWVRRDTTMSISKFIDEMYGGHAVTRVIKILLFGPPIYVAFIYENR